MTHYKIVPKEGWYQGCSFIVKETEYSDKMRFKVDGYRTKFLWFDEEDVNLFKIDGVTYPSDITANQRWFPISMDEYRKKK